MADGVIGLLGSPPYTWGAHPDISDEERQDRITPIYMGSTHLVLMRSH